MIEVIRTRSSRKEKKGAVAAVEDAAWLNEVREVRHPVDLADPLIVRTVEIRSGPPGPQPSVPFPERHPYCEIGFNFKGRCLQLIGAEKGERNDGDMLLMGPGIPHYALHLSYPQRSVTVHFLPVLLFELGPNGDGARFLARFTSPQKIGGRIVRPQGKLSKKLALQFEQMATEFAERKVGSEFRLRALLIETLVDIVRWEGSAGTGPERKPTSLNWLQVEKALRFMHEHYMESLYVKEIAHAVGLSVSRLQVTFREALGMSCVHYLRALRISHAKAELCIPEARVTEIALQVGFETLSHFNISFRSLIGMTPTEYIRSHQVKKNLNTRRNR